MIFGLTHQPDGTPISRIPKSVKVQIGSPRGPGINVFMDRIPAPAAQKIGLQPGDTGWVIEWTATNKWSDAKRIYYPNREACEENYPKVRATAAKIDHPSKLSYFTFCRLEGDEYVHDFQAIEAHGVRPTQIGIIFTSDDPFETKMANWSASELRCFGDGKTAQRLVKLAETPEEKALAQEAIEAGGKYFFYEKCAMAGCPFSLPSVYKDRKIPPACKPSGDLTFQLINNLRLGGRAYLHTGGVVSIPQIESALNEIRYLTGGVVSKIPFKLIVKKFKTNVDGRPGHAYGMQLEVYENKMGLRAIDRLLGQAAEFQSLAGRTTVAPPASEAPLALASGALIDDGDDEDGGLQESAVLAQAMANEFYHETAEIPTVAEQAAEATVVATTDLKKELEAQQQRSETAQAIMADAKPEPERITTDKLNEKLAAIDAKMQAAAEAPPPPPTDAPVKKNPFARKS